MFVKPFRTKSNVSIRSSDRKKVRSDAGKIFQKLSQEELNELIPNKEEMSVMKIYSHKGENVTVYCVKKIPILFEHDARLYPTVYTVWKYPKMMPCFTMQQGVFEKLRGGADLMLPGVMRRKNGLPDADKDQAVAVNTLGNEAALAVGFTLVSSGHMTEVFGMRGKGIRILHTFGDHLWMIGDKQQPPQIPTEVDLYESSMYVESKLKPDSDVSSDDSDEEFDNVDSVTDKDHQGESQGQKDCTQTASKESNQELEGNSKQNSGESLILEDQEVTTGDQEEDVQSEAEVMDELLHQCFLTALKVKLKDSELPILTSTFYRTHVLACCPSHQNLDIKKSNYKKLSKYLKRVEADGLVQVKELSKGNNSIISVSRSHPELKAFTPLTSDSAGEAEKSSAKTVSSYGVVTQTQYEPPEISAVHCVSGITLQLFAEMGYKKGDPLIVTEIRELVTQYIKRHDLVKTDEPRMVTLDPLLHRAMFDKGGNNILTATWEDVFKKVISKMQVCHQLKFKGLKPIIKTGGPPSINILVQQRASNKKVTIIENLESFLINPQQFAESIRKKAQASTSISNVSGASNKIAQQVLVQGNQVKLVDSLLTGQEYRIPRKYLRGLENIPKVKKKRR